MEPIPVGQTVWKTGKWLLRRVRLSEAARIEAEVQAGERLEKRLRFLEGQLAQEPDAERKLGLEREVRKVRDAIIGCHAETDERTLKRAKLPTFDELVASGRRRIGADTTNANQNNSPGSEKGTGG